MATMQSRRCCLLTAVAICLAAGCGTSPQTAQNPASAGQSSTSAGTVRPEYDIMTEHYPPYNYRNSRGEASGISYAIVKELLKRLNKAHLPIRMLPWNRAYYNVQNNTNSVVFSMSRTPAREKLFKWVGPLVSYTVCFYKLKTNPLQIRSLEEAKRVKSIGVVKNTSGEIYLRKLGFKNLDTVNHNYLNPYKLLQGRISLWMAGDLSGIYIARNYNVDPNNFAVAYQLRREHLYIALSKDIPDEVVRKWQQIVIEMHKDGTLQRLRREFRRRLLNG